MIGRSPQALAAAVVLVTATLTAEPARAAVGVEERVGARLPLDETFTTAQGEHVALRELLGNGKPALLVLSYAHCAMLCGVVLRGVSDLLREYPVDPDARFTFVNISIDPRETPHEAARIQASTLARAGTPSPLQRAAFLVGEQRSIEAVADAVGFRYAWDPATAQYAHPSVLFVIAADGRVARYFHGLRFEPDEVRAALFGPPTLAQSLKSAALACFRSDVLERRYGGAIVLAFRAGALSLLVALAALLFVFVRRGRAARGELGRRP